MKTLLRVEPIDIARMIGKQNRTAQSIRTSIKAVSRKSDVGFLDIVK